MIALAVTCAIFGLHLSAQKFPWCDNELEGHTGHNNTLQCMNGQLCVADGDNHDDDSWKCCNKHEGRAKCPLNYPNMCNYKTCADNTAYCCEVDCKDFGGKRTCTGIDATVRNNADDDFDDDDYEALDGEEEDLTDDDCGENDVEDDDGDVEDEDDDVDDEDDDVDDDDWEDGEEELDKEEDFDAEERLW